jgi:formylglycine-generating enzyme required for sulfatase activity
MKKTVFISYSTKDKETAAKVRKVLVEHGIQVTIDRESMRAGGNIRDFIDESIRETDVTLSIVSENSLASDWVAFESVESFAAEKHGKDKKFIACYIDDGFLTKADFTSKALAAINKQIEELKTEVERVELEGIDAPINLTTKIQRKVKLKNNLPDIILRLQESLTLDIREPEFETSMKRIIAEIKRLPELPSESPADPGVPTQPHQMSGIHAQAERGVAAETITAPVLTGDVEGGVHIHYHSGGKPDKPVKPEDPIPPEEKFDKAFKQRISDDKRQLDERFVQLILMIDNGETENERWKRESLKNIEEILRMNEDQYPVMVILGAPGSGKSTILRRLELDYYEKQAGKEKQGVPFFVPLNRYERGSGDKLPSPLEFLEAMWKTAYEDTGLSLGSLLREGRVLLLLDAINEIRHGSSEEYEQIVGQWSKFAIDHKKPGNRIIFTCRSLDYSQSLSSPEMRVPNVELQPLTREKVGEFLEAYLPEKHGEVFEEIRRNGTLDFYSNPYFLSLLCKQIAYTKSVPKGRASLFTGYVREAMRREMDSDLFKKSKLFTEHERKKLNLNRWADAFQLPEDCPLPGRLSHLAYEMQQSGQRKENKQVSIRYRKGLGLIGTDKAETIVEAGVAMKVLDWDIGTDDLTYHHQLLQEYFAGRRLAGEPKPELVSVEWRASEVRPSLAETIAGLANGDPLPPPGQTGWEETTLAALPMSGDPEGYVAQLMEQNLPLAARCAVSPEVTISEELKNRIREGLIARTQEMKADLRARIAAGEALGLIGDPRFKRYRGGEGEYLLPPLVEIPAGCYPIGDDQSNYDRERPAHPVELAAFRIGVFPVTNGEYAQFIAAGGYEDERWWDTPAALGWLREGGSEGEKQAYRDNRLLWQRNWTDEQIRALVTQKRATEKDVESFLWTRNSSDEEFERQLDEWYPKGTLYRQPGYWEDVTYNNPAQPVVGVSWYEARAYCNWLSSVTGEGYRLPTEVEFEAAARGREGRRFSYGNAFDAARCNTFESHIRRTTPVGIFANATPEGAFDLTGNAYTWTSTIFDQERFAYPWQPDQREEPGDAGSRRLVRGGSWYDFQDFARAAYRDRYHPAIRSNFNGFRVVCGLRPPSPGL